MSTVKDIMALLGKGFIPYRGKVPEEFYKELGCREPKKAEWFARPWSERHKNSCYICLGCKKKCRAVDPKGFQLLLPISRRRPSMTLFMPGEALSVDELLTRKKVLRVDEAAWALNLSTRRVYEMVQEGLLAQVPGQPVRVTSVSVRACLQPA